MVAALVLRMPIRKMPKAMVAAMPGAAAQV
jgi:hypothetical protein